MEPARFTDFGWHMSQYNLCMLIADEDAPWSIERKTFAFVLR